MSSDANTIPLNPLRRNFLYGCIVDNPGNVQGVLRYGWAFPGWSVHIIMKHRIQGIKGNSVGVTGHGCSMVTCSTWSRFRGLRGIVLASLDMVAPWWPVVLDHASGTSVLCITTVTHIWSPPVTMGDATYAPNQYSAAAFFGGHLLSIGGVYSKTTRTIHAFSFITQSWEHVADLPVLATAGVLSSEQLIVSSGARVFYGKLSVEFNNCCAMEIHNNPFHLKTLTQDLENIHASRVVMPRWMCQSY